MFSSNPHTPVRTVLFDLGGVLVDWDPRHLYRRLFTDEAAMERFLATVCTQAWNEEQDAGRPFREGVELLLARYPHHATEIRAYDARWVEMLRGAIEESVAILDELRRRRVPFFGLTNFSAEKFPLARERFGFLDWFEGILVSGEEGLKKPDPRIYHLAIERFGLVPAETLYVDDVEKNISAAALLGLKTHLFLGAAGLRHCLAGCGLLPEQSPTGHRAHAG
ncbi:MAG: HAD family phosphatase [Alphaproteobacteria bacterium]|nr:HAD family phosphatase [Alphaproteobacteria bacterium]